MKKIMDGKNMKFSIAKRGYDPVEVEDYIGLIKRDYETKLSHQQERIDELKKMNIELVEEVRDLRRKEASVGRAIEYSAEKAEEVDKAILARYALAVQRLKQFERKWLNFYADLATRSDIDDELKAFARVMHEVECDLVSVMKDDLHMTSIMPEVKVDDIGHFDIDEALHPEDNLEDICRDLGLI